MVIKGNVVKGLGEAKYWVGKIEEVFKEKTEMKLFYGTLNIKLKEPYIIREPIIILKKEEYGGTEDVLVMQCKINATRAYIVRTSSNNSNVGKHKTDIIEVVSDVNFREKFNLKDGDLVEIRNKLKSAYIF